jgi:hypothetical protein
MNGSCEFLLSLGTPASLWGSQCLRQQRAPLANQFLYVIVSHENAIARHTASHPPSSCSSKTAALLAQQLGYLVVASSVKYDGSRELTSIKLR